MRFDPHDLHFDPDTINRTVYEAVDDAMRNLDRSLQHLDDLPFGPGLGPRRERRAEWRREHRERRQHHEDRVHRQHRADREREDMHDTLKALERGEIDVDEAMARLGE